MDGFVTGLASILSSSISGAKGVPAAQNHTTNLQQFASNTILRGIVLSRGINSAVTIKTDQGNVTIQTDIPLKRGAEVALKIEQRMNENLARIISVNGQSLNKYLEGSQSQTTQDEIAASSPLLRPAATLAPTSSIDINTSSTDSALVRGVFLSKPTPSPAMLAQLPSQTQQSLANAHIGTSLQLTLVKIDVPSATGGMQPLMSSFNPQAQPESTANTNALSGPVVPTVNTASPASAYALSQTQKIVATNPQIQSAIVNQEAAQPTVVLTDNDGIALPQKTSQSGSPSTATTNNVNTATATPPQSTAPTPPVAQPSSPVPAANDTTPPTQQPASPLPAQTQAQTQVQAPAQTSVQPQVLPQPPTPTSSTPAQPLLLTAEVINNTNPRELTLHSDIGTFKLFVTTPLPKGSVIHFTLHHVADVRATPVMQGNAALTVDFEAMETISSLMHYPPNELTPSPPHLVPRPGAQLSAEMLFIMAALKGGGLTKWLGEDNMRLVDTIQSRSRSGLLAKLGSEFAELKTIPADIRDGQWHSMLIPLAAEGSVQPLRFYIKGESHKSASGTSHMDHFMVDLELTRLGAMQLDGLVQTHQRNIQFDLVVRTERDWEDKITAPIRDIFVRGQEITGFHGSISFKSALLPLPVDNNDQPPSNSNSIIA